ncbi:SAM-dependent methyltransferase [Sinobacterium caligoides]|uniref:SAM-dependent methyltransferase n=1 Tax=Sinobacterium caligoides TaxID=933926 RepID=A0A3N2DGJ2_9GAMM|nr:class I SAM-dependent rRNA methyltransferase [Sinobacterium caligoides]ROR98851.1 SAM-dependent methyltransferase [Sinobacterium caligoides]
MSTELAELRLKAKSDRRLKAGHLWIYSNEVDIAATPLKNFTNGQQVVVQSNSGKALGIAYVNPSNLICARLVTRNTKLQLNKSLLVHRLKVALSLRQRLFEQPSYRLIYGESDGLPGLVVDRFEDVVCVQISTAGMELVKDDIVEALLKVLSPRAIVMKNNTGAREAEGLEKYVEVVHGEIDDEVSFVENGVKFIAPILSGQKTGWFYDHRPARARLQQLCAGKRVLDVFSYIGGWGVQAAVAGASEVVCVDSSEQALDWVHKNAELNGVADRVTSVQGNAAEALQALLEEGEKFDVVIVDPPAFIKRRKDLIKGGKAYQKLNQLAIRLLVKDGLLFSASCSMHLPAEQLIDVVRGAARHIDRQAQILERFGQGADHPIHPSIPETEYIKTVLARILPAD